MVNVEEGLEVKDLVLYVEELDDFFDIKCIVDLLEMIERLLVEVEDGFEMKDLLLYVEELNDFFDMKCVVNLLDLFKISVINEDILVININFEGKGEMEDVFLLEGDLVENLFVIIFDVDNDLENFFLVSVGIENLVVMIEEIFENVVEMNGFVVKKEDCYNERCDFMKNSDYVFY